MKKYLTFINSLLLISLFYQVHLRASINPYIDSLNPRQNAISVNHSADIIVYFVQPMNSATINSANILVYDLQSGYRSCVISYIPGNKSAVINPNVNFGFGEQIFVELKSGIMTSTESNITPFTYTFFTASATAPATFYQSSIVNTGTFPETLTQSDFNNDGYLDIALVNLYSSNASVLLNNGNGSFNNFATLTTSSNPRSIVSGDFDGDGYIDLATGSHIGGTVNIFKNNGNGSFVQSQVMTLGNAPYSLVVGDFDKDGFLDLATANYNTSNVSILKNNGAGSFSLLASYTAAVGPVFISTGDFNNDGSLDLAVACWNSNSVSILLNNGNGSFVNTQTLTVGTNPHSLAVGDIDKDGFSDIIVVNSHSNNLTILKNNGNGSFIQNGNINIGTETISAILSDLNGDGNLDLAVSSTTTGVSIYTNNGNGTFSFSASYANVNTPRRLGVGDFDGDGKIDLAVPSANLNNVTILRNGIPPPAPPVLVYPPNGATGMPLTFTFIWYGVPNAVGYKIQVSGNSGFTNIVDSANLSTNQYSVPAGKLSNTMTYYWRVRTLFSGNVSDWSAYWNFTTINLPLAPVLISPYNNTVGVSLTPTLYWGMVSGASNYKVQISIYQDFSILTDSAITSNNQYVIPSGRLSNFVKYYWRVNASNGNGTGLWSEIWNFTTLVTGVNNISSEIPKVFNLYVNYPNPFNPDTKINFDIANPSGVKIRIYDIAGREIETLINTQLQPGKYFVIWNAKGFPSGVYFYQLITNEYSNLKKMILAK